MCLNSQTSDFSWGWKNLFYGNRYQKAWWWAVRIEKSTLLVAISNDLDIRHYSAANLLSCCLFAHIDSKGRNLKFIPNMPTWYSKHFFSFMILKQPKKLLIFSFDENQSLENHLLPCTYDDFIHILFHLRVFSRSNELYEKNLWISVGCI